MTNSKKIIVTVTKGSHRYNELIGLLIRDNYLFDVYDEEGEMLYKKRLTFEFASWLSEQNFTNPDISCSEWVNTFFSQKYKDGH